jgi:hypothetical protein
MKKQYETPELQELGTLEELTLQSFNKVGRGTDIYTQLTQGAVIGSLVGLP